MGSYFRRPENPQDNSYSCDGITFGKLITQVQCGDIILLQEPAYVDNYTIMNSQEAHYMKHFLRFKCKENPNRDVQLWSRACLVVDSDISDERYLLEITEKGFELNEILSRMMEFKRDNDKVVGWLRYASITPITEHQKLELIKFSKFLQGKNWKGVMREDAPEHTHRVEAIQSALFETKRILEKVATSNDASFVRDQLEQVFRLFTQVANQTDQQILEASLILGHEEEPVIQPADIDAFLCFLTVNQKEKDEIVTPMVLELNPKIKEMRIKKTEQDIYHERGLNFHELMSLLNQVDFFGQFELTEKERLSVLSTQIIIEIIDSVHLLGEFHHEFKVIAEDANDIFNLQCPFEKPLFGKPKLLISRSTKH